MSSNKIFKDFDIYSRSLIASKDADPTYPMINEICNHFGFEPEWFAFLYVSFYNLESGIRMAQKMPERKLFSADLFLRERQNITKFGHERRGTNRTPLNQIKALSAAIQFLDVLEEVRLGKIQAEYADTNQEFREIVSKLPFHGIWASFKIAEIFEKALGYKHLEINDLGIEGKDANSNDGPIGGLRWLYGREDSYDAKTFIPHWNRFGANLAKAWGVDIGEVETCLCKFHKLCSGNYFIGHDIQEFAELKHVLGRKTYENIMSKHFHPKYWDGIDGVEKNKKSVYANTGKIINTIEADFPEVDVLEIICQTD